MRASYRSQASNPIDRRAPSAWTPSVAKILRFGGVKTDVAMDLYNLFNLHTPTAYNQAFLNTANTPWLRPTRIVDARFVRVNVTVSY